MHSFLKAEEKVIAIHDMLLIVTCGFKTHVNNVITANKLINLAMEMGLLLWIITYDTRVLAFAQGVECDVIILSMSCNDLTFMSAMS